MTEEMKLNAKRIMEDSDFVQSIKKVAQECGYDLYRCWNYKWTEYNSDNDDNDFEIYFEPVNQYSPDLYIDTDRKGNIDIAMGTTSYGTLRPAEVRDYLSDIQGANKLIDYLLSLDWSNCPVLSDNSNNSENNSEEEEENCLPF